MLYILAIVLLPPLLVFGVYHLALWVDLARVRSRAFWQRLATASAVSHVLLAIGFFLFSYLDYRINGSVRNAGLAFDAYFFDRSPFWSLAALFDTISMVVLLGIFAVLDRFGIPFGATVALTAGIVLIVGTFQWYWLGGGIGAALERLWRGLKGPEDDDENLGHWL